MCRAKNLLCKTAIVVLGLLQCTQAAFLRCYNGSLDNYLVTPLNEPLALSSCINTQVPTLVYTFGYRGKIAGPATTAVLTAYVAKKKRNVILLDWEVEAQSGMLGIQLGYALNAVPNAKRIGRELGYALMELSKAGVNMADIHLMGHSLGSHVMAFAGKQTRENGHVVGRITGLDPARALFEGAFAFQTGLDRTCAKFVDIVHTDPGGYGIRSSVGTVDIWPNYTGKSGTQPGCPVGNFETFSIDERCSHDRSWEFYVESLASPTAFPAAAAFDFDGWVTHGPGTNQTTYLGDLTSTRAKGNYYLKTDSKAPFGMGTEGMIPDSNQTRRRRTLLTRILKYLD